MEKGERAAIVFQRLAEAAPCSNAAEAMQQLEDVMNGVEDEFITAPYNPAMWATDGRLYPPQADMARETANPDVTRYRNRKHTTWIGANGALKIARGSTLCLEKPGSDGRTITSMMGSIEFRSSSTA